MTVNTAVQSQSDEWSLPGSGRILLNQPTKPSYNPGAAAACCLAELGSNTEDTFCCILCEDNKNLVPLKKQYTDLDRLDLLTDNDKHDKFSELLK